MRHLDLFSGIGGFALAASWVWPQHEVVAFCEIDPFCQQVLRKHWPNTPIHPDIKQLTNENQYGTVDLVTGGFPCQPFSGAGKRKGTEDDRYLWPEMLRAIAEFSPRWVVAENVSGIYTIERGMVFEAVCTELENQGYYAQPLRIPACATGALHRRDRWWFVAQKVGTDADRNRKQQPTIPRQNERLRVSVLREDAADANGIRWSQVEQCNSQGKERARAPGATSKCAINSRGENWCDTEPSVGRVAHGVPRRVDRLRALGNAIVPQVAAEIFRAMKLADHSSLTHH